MSTLSDNRNPVEGLAEEFLDRRRRGEPATPEEYAESTGLADEILALFPALLIMEELGDDAGGTTRVGDQRSRMAFGAPRPGGWASSGCCARSAAAAWAWCTRPSKRSLGRRVALKVLPASVLTDAKQVRRFEREAGGRAAAPHQHRAGLRRRQHEGTHYYVMQFIQGQGLDAVLDELGGYARAALSRTGEPGRPATRQQDRPASGRPLTSPGRS